MGVAALHADSELSWLVFDVTGLVPCLDVYCVLQVGSGNKQVQLGKLVCQAFTTFY